MKLLISNQHGAIVMALLPFFYGMLRAGANWGHLALLLAWSSLYLMTYPFLNLFKPQIKDKSKYRRWTLIYAAASAVFSLPVFYFNWQVIYFGLAMLPLVGIAIYYAHQNNERALLNDFAGIAIFALAGMAAYYFTSNRMDFAILQVVIYPSLFFTGTTLYVKSVLRERKNPHYFWSSVFFHVSCVLIFGTLQEYSLALVFLPPLIRALLLPSYKLSVKKVGLTEMGVSLLFFIMLIWATI